MSIESSTQDCLQTDGDSPLNRPALPVAWELHLDAGKRFAMMNGHPRERFGQGLDNLCLGILEMTRSFPGTTRAFTVPLSPDVQGMILDSYDNCSVSALLQ
jgi:hypothetical protein